MTRSIEPASTSVGWPPPLELLLGLLLELPLELLLGLLLELPLGLLLELPLGLPEGWPAPRSLPEG